MTGYLYILQSEKTSRYYIGSTEDIVRRFDEHQRGQTISTKNGVPWKIAFQKEYRSIEDAKKMETKLKRWKSKKIIDQIVQEQEIHTGP